MQLQADPAFLEDIVQSGIIRFVRGVLELEATVILDRDRGFPQLLGQQFCHLDSG